MAPTLSVSKAPDRAGQGGEDDDALEGWRLGGGGNHGCVSIVRALAQDGECHCGAFDLPVTKSTGTHHFRVLRESGVIEQVADGTARINRLRCSDLDARFPGLLDSVLAAQRT